MTASLHAAVQALNTNAIQKILCKRASVSLTDTQYYVELQSASICCQMDFGTKATTRAT